MSFYIQTMFNFLIIATFLTIVLSMQITNLINKHNQYRDTINSLSFIIVAFLLITISCDGLELLTEYNQLKDEYIRCIGNITT